MDQINKLFRQINDKFLLIDALTPLNKEVEFNKFVASNYRYNPQFTYQPINSQLIRRYQEKLLAIVIPEHPTKSLYEAKRQEYLNYISIFKTIGLDHETFCSYVDKIYPFTVQSSLINIIEKILKTNLVYDGEILDYSNISDLFRERLEQLQLPSKIHIVDSRDTIMVSKRNGDIYIPKHIKRRKDSILGAIAHEVDIHLQRFFNAQNIEPEIFRYGTANYLETEEGLATLASYSVRQNKSMYKPALMYRLISIAQTSSFIDTFAYAYEKLRDIRTSWYLTLRTKRGISDTSNRGAFSKDQYFLWTIKTIQQLINFPEYYNYAINGKGSLKELSLFTHPRKINLRIDINEIQAILNTNYLNEFLKDNG